MPEFVAYPSLWRRLLMLSGAVALAFGALVMTGVLGNTPSTDYRWAAWAFLLFFGAAAIAIAWRLFDRAAEVRISASGLYFRQWSEDTVLWSEIRDVTSWHFRGQSAIVLHLYDPTCYPSTKLLGKLAGANRMLTGGDICITMTGTDQSAENALRAIARFRPD